MPGGLWFLYRSRGRGGDGRGCSTSYLLLPVQIPRAMVELLSLVLAVLLGFGWATAAVPHAIRPYQTSTAPAIDYNVSPIPISSHKDYAQVYQGRSVKRAKLIVEDGEVTIAGVTTPAALVNGTMPGPTLRFTAGDGE